MMKFKTTSPKKTKSYKVPHNSPPDINTVVAEAEADESSELEHTANVSELRQVYDAELKNDPACMGEACKAARAAWKAARRK